MLNPSGSILLRLGLRGKGILHGVASRQDLSNIWRTQQEAQRIGALSGLLHREYSDGPVPAKVRNPRPRGIVPIGEDYGGYNEEKHEQYEDDAEKSQMKIKRWKKLVSTGAFVTVFVGVMWARNRKQKQVYENTKSVKFLPKDELFTGSYGSCCLVESENGDESSVMNAAIVQDGTLRFIQGMEFRTGDVVVASFPKTGTTWVQEIVFLVQSHLDFEKAKNNIEDRFPFLEYPYPGAKSIEKMKSPRLLKTHLPFFLLPHHTERPKIIYVTRNPKDTAVSYYHFLRMLSYVGFEGTFTDFIERFTTDKLPYTPFFSHMEGYLRHNEDPNCLIISYEDLSNDPSAVVNKIALFLDKQLTAEEISKIVGHTSFKAMANNSSVNYQHWDELGMRKKGEAPFMRVGKVGDWRNYFDASLNEKFEKWLTERNKLNVRFEYGSK